MGSPSVESASRRMGDRRLAVKSTSSNDVGGEALTLEDNGIKHASDTPSQTSMSPDGEEMSYQEDRRDRKQLGIYYTPSSAARILCTWAIRDSGDLVLEPSFGACGFLEAARDRLKDVGAVQWRDNLFGCDIDPEAFSGYLEPKLGLKAQNGRFLSRNFLSVQPDDFACGSFDVIVGNPPYVSYHNMDAHQRMVSELAMVRIGLDSGPKSSLWAHFLLYAMSFLNEGGKMAWLLPSSFLYADYAERIREHIEERFERSLIVQLGQRLFLSEGTEESTAVLLAEGYTSERADTSVSNRPPGSMLLDFAKMLPELEESIEEWMQGKDKAKPFEGRAAAVYLSGEVKSVMERASEAGSLVQLGDIADIRIGIVTGANSFFIIDEAKANEYGLPDEVLHPILAKFSMAPGMILTRADLALARAEGKRLLLVGTEHADLTAKASALRNYLASIPRSKRHANKTFNRRELWHRPDDGCSPDAFFPYMYHHGPRLILNEAETTSTNTIHRVYFKEESFTIHNKLPGYTSEGSTVEKIRLSKMGWRRMCALSILSTFSQLSGELQGRSYGAGILKHEPSEAKRILLILPRPDSEDVVDTTFQQVDRLLRIGNFDEARMVADCFVLKALPPNEQEWVRAVLGRALKEARTRRRPLKRVGQNKSTAYEEA